MNRFDDNNMTLPITKNERKHKRGVSIGGSIDILSETQMLRRQAKPRKSILKGPAPTEEWDEQKVDMAATIDFGRLDRAISGPRASMPVNPRMSLGPRRRVSFAPNTHVRMFDQPEKRLRRKSSMLPRQFGNSSTTASQSPSRSRPSLPVLPSSRSSLPGSAPPTSPRARFLGEGDEMSEASMEIESDQSYASSTEDSDDILTQVQAMRPTTPVHTPAPDGSSDVDAESEMDMDETVIRGGIVPHRWADDSESDSDSGSDMSIEGTAADTDEEMTMDFTVALGGPMPRVPPQDALRGRASIGYSVPSAPGQSPFLPGDAVSDNETMEMEETVAYGAVYNDESTSSSDNSNINRAGDHTATYNMDFTSVGGGIYQDESAMDMSMTAAQGGINHNGMDMIMAGTHGSANESAMDMTMTRVHGGINDSEADMTITRAHWETEGGNTSALDFTTAGGGIAYKSTSVYGAATTMMTNIFAPAPTPALTPAPKSPARPTTTPATRFNIFAPTPVTSGIPRPRASIKPALTPFAPVSARAPEPSPEPTLEDEEPIVPQPRVQGGSATPARPTGGTPGRKARRSVGTPSFARSTSSSTQKKREPSPMPQKTVPSSAQRKREVSPSAQKSDPTAAQQKKRNIFGASPEPDGEPTPSRSKLRTPMKSGTGLETAASVAKKLDFSTGVRASTPATSASTTPSGLTPKTISKMATPKAATPKAGPKVASSSTTPRATPSTSSVPHLLPSPSSLKRAREDEGEAEDHEREINRAKRRRSSVVPSSPRSTSIGTGEEDMSLEESEEPTPTAMDRTELWLGEQPPEQEVHEPTPALYQERQVTPDPVEERPLPSYTPIRRDASGRSTPRRTPRKSLGPPRRSIFVEPEPEVAEPEPKLKPEPEIEPVDLMTHLPSQPGVDVQNVPLSTFLEMVGIFWQDDLIGRKSLAVRADNIKSQFAKGHEFPLPEYVEANLESVFLSMLSWADAEITQKIQQSREILTTIERLCSEDNPPVVHDYLAADEEDRAMFEGVLLQIKSVTYLRARARWYDWKHQILSERVGADIRDIRDDMLADEERHSAERKTIDRVLPDLRKRRDELEAELAAHRAQVEAVLACDPEEIAALREGIEEQDTELERFRTELEGKNAKNAEVEEELVTLTAQRDAHKVAIDAAHSMCDQATVGDVMRLDAELEALQALHGWRVVRAGPRLELQLGEFGLAVPVDALERATLSLKDPQGPDAGLLALAQAALVAAHPASLRALIDTTTQLWGAARGVRDELRRLALYYPVAYEVGNATLTVNASLVLPKARARASLSLTLGPDVLTSWPEAARALPVEVKPAYGRVDAGGLRERARETLASADLSLAGVLFQACAEAAALYS
ncbi:uncharacterized protein CcaverHIS019_0305030 [Cutaneotrichosporon cavernicola]|uniref:Spc7 kinetochore protein domain-containing protein n=1 Tax=Cutaneotrichosporon cavernicola TaxID=279322 RepID=A0AA48IGT6_9TREE|nr:uncharacterized protein CcaverHIS019_0305030 [Cutaneotrichosporon cavernicola]BEI90433.1 hypothetical protein CcaverHIS019_0305030 [Cutaneotrichosporon cavernicola]BEI98208.1 hypothetical protein CcaverHIS631_0305070 [Cutaneotrichosporon cavernicola]BEJ05984.1 hypothetical protein CcaverHIS641_0305060 [Cutaneotrichosporon cavernicola]